MKVAASVVALAASANAAHVACAAAMAVTHTNSSEFKATDGNDAKFEAICSDGNYFRDQFFKWTPTCPGASIGLITLRGNENVTRMTAGLTTGGCDAPMAVPVLTAKNAYAPLPTDAVCVSDTQKNVKFSDDRQQRIQFIADGDTEYILAVGTSSNANATLVGEFNFDVTFECATQASLDIDEPTVVMAGTRYAYHNIGSGVGTPSDCTSANNVFFAFTPACEGDIEFSMIPTESPYDGFHGEDFKISIYDNTDESALVCQDDPAIIASNTSENPTTLGSLIPDGGIVAGTTYTIVIGSYSTEVSPFILALSDLECPPTAASASALGMSVASILAAAFL